MDLRQLRYFVTIADTGTFSAAAKALYMSQPPLSAQIQSLEQELGVKLFERTTRRLRLTDAGRVLYMRAQNILDISSSVKKELEDIRKGASGTIRLGIISSLCGPALFCWMKDFSDRHPGVSFDLYEDNTYALLEKVQSRQAELALVRTPFSAPELSAISLKKEPLCAVGLPEFFENCGDIHVSVNEIKDRPLLLYRRWERILNGFFQSAAISPKILCVGDDARTIISLSRAGFGIGIVPMSTLREDLFPKLSSRILRPEFSSGICAVYRKDTYMSQITQLFLEETRKFYEKSPESFSPEKEV